MRWLAIRIITVYQHTVSPLLPGVCRYSPTCSHYTQEAIAKHGVLKGAWLGVRRISRCNPKGGLGYDPVP